MFDISERLGLVLGIILVAIGFTVIIITLFSEGMPIVAGLVLCCFGMFILGCSTSFEDND